MIKTSSEQQVEIFSGDWGELNNVMESEKYDIILSSDTLYCTANYKNFIELVKYLLRPNGVA